MGEGKGNRRRRRVVAAVIVVLVLGLCLGLGGCMLMMPGKSHAGPLPPLSESQRALAERLRGDVVLLAETIGERNVWQHERYMWAASEIEKRLGDAGYRVARQEFQAMERACVNVEAAVDGTEQPGEIVVIGAHYDSVHGTVGANDNASGVAALLAIAEALKGSRPARTLRFVGFANEEPPFFQTDLMGSVVYARACKNRGENIVAMVSFDGLGFYSDAPQSQQYPPPLNLLYPSTANFIGFVSNFGSLGLTQRCIGAFRKHARFPSEGGFAPESIPGVGWSDHWSFWQSGYKAVMVTDSLPFRYAHYHTVNDTPDKLDYEKMARVVEGLVHVTKDLAGVE